MAANLGIYRGPRTAKRSSREKNRPASSTLSESQPLRPPRPRRPAAGGRRKTTGAGGLGFAPLTSAALSSGALSRGRRGVRKAAAATRAAAPTARKPASAASRAKMSQKMKDYAGSLSAFKKGATKRFSASAAQKKTAAESRDRSYAAHMKQMAKSIPRPSSGARKKAPPSQSAQMAERKKYGRATAEFAKKRGGTAGPPSGTRMIPKWLEKQGAKRSTGAKRRASLAKSVGRGVRGPGLGGRR